MEGEEEWARTAGAEFHQILSAISGQVEQHRTPQFCTGQIAGAELSSPTVGLCALLRQRRQKFPSPSDGVAAVCGVLDAMTAIFATPQPHSPGSSGLSCSSFVPKSKNIETQ